MTFTELVEQYVNEVEKQFRTGHAKEHAYRPALERLMSGFEDVVAVNDPKRSAHGNPDFVFLKKSNQSIILGYAEAKDIDVSLDKTETTDQMTRYGGYENLFLSNYIEFRFFQNGNKYQTVSIGSLQNGQLVLHPENYSQLGDELAQFLELPPESIKSGKRLAQIMGAKARRIRDNVAIYLKHEDNEMNHELEKIYGLMKELLVHDLSPDKFADMYAQTLVYGLFVARYSDTSPDTFTRSEARDLVPASNPFLREFFDHIVGPRFDKRLGYIVDELCEVFSVSDVHKLVQKHLRLFEVDNEKDPIIHFYEDFLKEYDPKERKKMGAYYTPIPVVNFIVKSVDEILKSDFDLPKGLADNSKRPVAVKSQGIKHKIDMHRVQILDPAVGTATFLNETVKFIQKSFVGQEGRWVSYAKQDLLPRLHGFELMMAPYTIAHLKLGMTLQETGVNDFSQRLGVYLTNTLEEGIKQQQDLFSIGLAEVVTMESHKAAEIKHERPIMVVIGNPPYSGHSSNNTEYANSLVAKYKLEPGGVVKLKERNAKWINDDYVKFIAFAEDMIEKNGSGVVAMITNNGYLDNPTFRGMRWHLTKTFDKIYILDLHGSSKKKETALDGSKDENVFDIQQGVSIIIASKTTRSTKKSELYHAEIYGKRSYKFSKLNASIEWNKSEIDEEFYNFVPTQNPELKKKYDKFISLEDLFIKSTLGFQTHRDSFAISDSKSQISSRFNEMISDATDEEILNKYKITDNRDWKIAAARERARSQSDIEHDSLLQKCAYRPFDIKYTYLDEVFSDYPRALFKKHLSNKNNLVLGVGRQGLAVGNIQWCLVTVSKYAMDANIFRRGGVNAYPLYLYHDDGTKTTNFKTDGLKRLTANLKIDTRPEDVFDYLYAILHSPTYRDTYKEFLKNNYPKLPIPENDKKFDLYCSLGRKLRELHLMENDLIIDTTYPVSGTDKVESVKYSDNCVWFNDVQYFGNVPEVAWNFVIGGYQPAEKWLKDRKNRVLTNDDIEHYQRIIKILIETDKLMKQIDEV